MGKLNSNPLFKTSLEYVRNYQLKPTKDNLILCSIYTYNLAEMLKTIKYVCSKYNSLKSQLVLLELLINVYNELLGNREWYDPDKNTIKAGYTAYYKSEADYWAFISGSYAIFATKIKQDPELCEKVKQGSQDKQAALDSQKWLIANIDKILDPNTFSYAINLLKEVLSNVDLVEAEDKALIWGHLFVLVDNCQEEKGLVDDTQLLG